MENTKYKFKRFLKVTFFRIYHKIHKLNCIYFEKEKHTCKFDSGTHNCYLWCNNYKNKCYFNGKKKEEIII